MLYYIIDNISKILYIIRNTLSVSGVSHKETKIKLCGRRKGGFNSITSHRQVFFDFLKNGNRFVVMQLLRENKLFITLV